LNTFRSEYADEQKRSQYAEEQIIDYTDLYNTNREQEQNSSDEFGMNKEKQALPKCQPATSILPRPVYSAELSSNGCPLIWWMNKEKYISGQVESKVQLSSSNLSLFGLAGEEASFKRKVPKISVRRRE